MELFNLLLCFLFLYTCIRAFCLFSSNKSFSGRLPPGPTPFPVVGNLPQIGKEPHKAMAKLAKKYGPIMSLKLGQVRTVIISSPTMAREILQRHDLSFCNRTIPDSIRAHQHDQFSLAWIPVAKPWRNLRKISNSHLFTPKKLDENKELRREKVQELLADVEESSRAGVAVDIGKAAFKTTTNLISNTVFSIDLFDSKSELAREFKDVVSKIMEDAGRPNLSDYFPVLRKIDLLGIRRRQAINFGKLLELFDGLISERLNLRKEEGYVTANDLLDTLLSISEEDSDQLDRNNMEHFLMDIFIAGTETSSNAVEWAMSELLRHPKTLQKAKEELNKTIGKGNPVQESDISRLPYLQAVVKETFRLRPPGAFLIPRRAETDVEISGFIVPKDSQVLVSVWAIGRDPEIWDNPTLFLPERFLGSDIDVRGQDFELIPFGAGRRICPGMPLATRMVHLILGSLIHLFDWRLEDGVTVENMDMDDKLGLSLQKARALRAVPISS